MAIVGGQNIESLQNGVIFLSESVCQKLRELTMHSALFDKNDIGFMYGREVEDRTIYLTELVTPKDLVSYGKRYSDEVASTTKDKMYVGLKTMASRNLIRRFVLCSICTHSNFDDEE